MTAKFKSIQLRLTVLTLMMLFVPLAAKAADPGLAFPSTSEMSDQKAGSLLVYNYFSSSACCALQENSNQHHQYQQYARRGGAPLLH